MNWFPVGTKTRSSACGTAIDTSRSETGGGECRRMRCRLRVAEPFTGEKVALCSVTRFALHLISQLALTASPQGEAKEDIRGRTFNSPRFDLSALCGLY